MSFDFTEITVWDTEEGRAVGEPLASQLIDLHRLWWSADGTTLVGADASGRMDTWNLEVEEWIEDLDGRELIDGLDGDELHARGFAERELEDLESDELLQTIDELAADQLEELGLDPETIGQDPEAIDPTGWTSDDRPAPPVRSRSPIGRMDLSLVYRHVDPIASERRDELLLVGTWRR